MPPDNSIASKPKILRRGSFLRNLFTRIVPTTTHRYVSYAAMGGAVGSFLGFGEVIARKSLHSSGLAITMLTMLAPIASLSTLWWARLLVGRSQRKLILFVGSAGVLALASGFFLASIEHLLLIYLIFFSFVNGLYGQAENRVLQQHISPNATGKTFGMGQSMAQAVGALVSAGAGFYMDKVPSGYQHLFLASAIIAMMSMAMLASIRTTTGTYEERERMNSKFLLSPLANMYKLLKKRPDFLRFEISFMLYGTAFMMVLPVVPLFLVDDLKFSYSQIGMARGMVTQLVMIAGVPFFGRIFDRTTPHRMAVWIFASLAVYPLALLAALPLEGVWRSAAVYFAYAWFGFSMSGLTVIWSLSSMRFSAGEDSGIFQSVHVAATSLRACYAPLLGFAVMHYFGKVTTLFAASGVWLLASASVYIMRRIDVKHGVNYSLRAK